MSELSPLEETGMSYTFGFVGDIVFAHNAQAEAMPVGHILRDSPGAALGAKCDVYNNYLVCIVPCRL